MVQYSNLDKTMNTKAYFKNGTNRKTTRLLAVIIVIITSCSVVTAQDWHQYLGPNRDSKSPQKNLLRSWLEKGPEVLWTVGVGIGYGGPVVKNGKVYLLDREDGVEDFMRCFDLKTGKELWKFTYPAPGTFSFPGSRSVPIVDDRFVYSVGGNGDLYCFDINTHKPVWNKNVWTDFGGEELPTWGICQNPVIYGNLLVVASQAPQTGVVAYDKLTGNVVWKTPNLGVTGYSNPKVVKIDGEDQIVFATSSSYHDGNLAIKGNVTGMNPRTGEILWRYSDWETGAQVPCAVEAGDNKLLIVGEQRATMLKINKKPDGTFDVSEIFTTYEFGDETKTPLFHNGYFYAMHRTVKKREGLVCMNTNGEIIWKTRRNPNFDFGSMIFADGLIIATDGNKMLYLIEPDPTAFKMISQAEMLGQGGATAEGWASDLGSTQNYAPIALADGILLIRDQFRMFALKVAK
jgi:outer membrane protein assembly factor BamB